MITNFMINRINKSSLFFLTLTLIVFGVGAQASGVLNSPSGGYLICVDSKTKVVTHPGKLTCPKGSKSLVLGAQGASGADGKTLWSGVEDPESTWGAPGDMFINSATNTFFGPKDAITGWPAGVSLVGPKGDQGPQGPRGPQGRQGPSGSDGTDTTLRITELSLCDGDDDGAVANEICRVGMTGPGGGIIFFVDYDDVYQGLNYLEVAPVGWGNAILVNQGGLSGETTGSAVNDPLMKWCSNPPTLFNPDLWSNAGVGKGAINTSTADATCTGGAIRAAASYTGGGKTDWFLPSIGEAMLMYDNLRQLGVGGFMLNPYWSSSESGANNAWRQYFNNGDQTNNGKNTTDYVRPIRAF